MAMKDELRFLIDRITEMEKPVNVELLDELKAVAGVHPSIETLEELLKQAKARRDEILRTDIPCILQEYGLASATMDDGVEVTTDTFYETRQKDKDMLAKWLELNGYGAIIKDTLALDKGAFDARLESFLSANGYSYSKDSNVNGMTLKKTLKDHLAAGGDRPPLEAVEITIYEAAKIKFPKASF